QKRTWLLHATWRASCEPAHIYSPYPRLKADAGQRILGAIQMSNQLGSSPDLEQLIKDAKYARMEFVRKNFRFFAYGSGFLGLVCAFTITVFAVGSTNRDPQATQISHAAKTTSKPLSAVH